MRTHRRGFFRVLGGALALVMGRTGAAHAEQEAPEIHTGTSNYLFGPAGKSRPKRLTPLPNFKPYPGAERRALPPREARPDLPLAAAVRGYRPSRHFLAESLGLDVLSRLLHLTNGVTGPYPGEDGSLDLRAAPSAGALYAGEVYAVAERVRDLPSGLYYYAVAEHELVRLRSGSFESEVLRALEGPRGMKNAAVLFLLSNVFDRYTWRYANRGYRYALIDSGHIGENLRLAACAEGLGEASPLRFHDDALNALLEIDGRAEAVCAVHAVGYPGSAAEGGEGSSGAFLSLGEKQDVAPESVPAEGHLTDRYHEATKLVPTQTKEPPSRVPPAVRAGSGVALPTVAPPPATTVGACIRRRRSPKHFREQPIGFEDLAFVLEMARGHAALERAPGVDLSVVAHRVRGLAPGLYRFEPRDPGLALVRQCDLTRSMVRACQGQENAGAAAAGLVMVGRFAGTRSLLGDRSYRDQLLESGAIGERIYLAAEAAGLAARNLASFKDEELNELVGLDGRREAILHLTMLGHRA